MRAVKRTRQVYRRDPLARLPTPPPCVCVLAGLPGVYVVFASPYVSKCSSSSRSLARRLERYSALPPPQPHTRASQHCVAYPQTVHRALDMAFWLATTRLLSFGITMWTLLLLSALVTTIETMQLWRDLVPTSAFIAARLGFNVIFTLEAAARVLTYQPMRFALRSPILWLDVLTVVPFWVRLTVDPGCFTPANYYLRKPTALDFLLRILESLASV